MTIADKLQKFKATLKLQAIADRAGISRSLLSKYANQGSIPPADKAFALANALGVSVDWLLDDTQAWPPVWTDRNRAFENAEPESDAA